MSDLIKREDAIDAICDNCKLETDFDRYKACGNCKDVKMIMDIPSAERKGEWIDCKEPPSTNRNVFIAYGTDDMKSVCIGHYEHDMKLWYEDKNFFAKPIYDAMYWCEIPQFPARMKGAEDE